MKKRVKDLLNMSTTYEIFMAVGLLMIFSTAIKLAGLADFSSDWFWLVGGLGVTIEGAILLKKQRMFDRKYKVVPREVSADVKN